MVKHSFFAAAQAMTEDGGIYRFGINSEGRAEQGGFAPLPGCNYLVFSPDRKIIYATCIIGDAGGVAAFRINEDLSLTELNRMPSGGKSTCHLTTDKDGEFLFCANYSSGSFSEFRLAKDGSIAERTRVICHHGHGVNPVRQECAHVHQTMLTPDKKYLCVTDLGVDKVFVYPLDRSCGVLENEASFCNIEPAGAGPRHLVFNQSGDIAYLLNELNNTVSRLDYAHGKLTLCRSYDTMPAGYAGFSKAAAIRLSFDGRFLLASNRGCDTIAVFKVLDDGDLERRGLEYSMGESPRDFDFIADGSMVAVTNENNDNMTIFTLDTESGKLSPAEQYFSLPHPLCILNHF